MIRRIYRNCTKEAYLESQDVRQDLEAEKVPKISAQTVTDHIRGFAHVHGVINWVTLHKTV